VPDEPLLADTKVHFQGMPIAIVLATNEALAHKAAKLITAEIDELEVVTDLDDVVGFEVAVGQP
jgi:xanthine dehydrogenase molybdopterin-binding subunit B